MTRAFLRRFALATSLATSLATALSVAVAPMLLPQQAYAAETFQDATIASAAVRLAESLKRGAPAALTSKPVAQLRKEATVAMKEPRKALPLLGAAITLAPDDWSGWLAYARASAAVDTDDYNERETLRTNALAAAYTAYQRAAKPADKAAALALLADIHTRNSFFRDALNAYKASLALADNMTARKAYEELREQYGFRILANSVDSDAASPRACFQFSEQLAKGVDYAPFVAVAGSANAAISTEYSQLCVDGLKHGERYAVVLRQGLPSAIGEDLLRNADYDIYVRDRAPQVRFTGRNYVLPAKGQEGIPLVSVNTRQAEIDIFRIGDRNVLPALQNGNFLEQLSRFSADTIRDDQGQKIWGGTIDTASTLNQDEITAFPLHEALGEALKPGIHVMTARPAGGEPADEDYGQRATQWFVVSDIGLTALSNDGGIGFLVRSLSDATPLKDVEVRLLARNNEVLATAVSDAQGRVAFDPGLARGQGGLRPGLAVATTKAGDYNLLDLSLSPLDLTDRGVEGRTAPGPLDGMVFAERGVYRTGETVYVTALLRDGAGKAAAGLPLTLVAQRPDGVEYKRAVVNDQGLGGRAWSLPLLPGAAHGTWRVLAYADPKGQPVGETTFLVEDYVPERLNVVLKPQAQVLNMGGAAQVAVQADYLFGAPGAGLQVSGEITLRQADKTAIAGFEDFTYGLTDEAFEGVTLEVPAGTVTDARGAAVLTVPLPQVQAQRAIEAQITLRVAEPGGRAVERVVTLPVLPAGHVVLARPMFKDLTAGAEAVFEVAVASPDGSRKAMPVRWTLSRIEQNYQWFNRSGSWSFETITSVRRVRDGELNLPAEGVGSIAAPVEWGEYRLDITVADGQVLPLSYKFQSGFSGVIGANTPDKLDIVLDKAAYNAGDTMSVTLKPRYTGKATVVIASDKLHEERIVDVSPDGATVTLPVKAEWGPGAYVLAFAHRPLDTAARRMPGRAIGVAWFSVDRQARSLSVELGAPQNVTPRQVLSVPVKINGLTAGQEAFVTVAAVDAGILNLTRYEAPQPDSYFFGQRQLGTEVRDLYGFLIDGMQGTRGAIRSGGDGGAVRLEGAPPTQEPLAVYSGVVKVGPDGVAQVEIPLPAFNGTVRVMATAWTADRAGHAATDVVVRDPVVLTGTLPRFLNVGDESRLLLTLDNVAGPAGEYAVSIAVEGPLDIAANQLNRTVQLGQNGTARVSVPVKAREVGQGRLDVRLNGQGLDVEQSFNLAVAPGTPPLTLRALDELPSGEALELTKDLLNSMHPGTGVVSLAVTPVAALDVPALLAALDRFPYGCTEQTVSRALPLLYINALAAQQALQQDGDTAEKVRTAIARILSRQDSVGSFGLWSVGGDDLWLDAFVADFLTRAREQDFAVPQAAFNLTLDRLRNNVVNSESFPEGEGQALAYAAYVLARNGRPVMGDLRYFADVRLSEFGSPLAKAQIGAALALLGERARAETAFRQAVDDLENATDSDETRNDYGSRLRDAAGVMALIGETDVGTELLPRLSSLLDAESSERSVTSTQENTWLVLAARAIAKQAADLSLEVDGAAHQGPLYRNFSADELAQPVVITNTGKQVVKAVTTVQGAPLERLEANEQGYAIERRYVQLDGKPANLATVKQNDRFVVVLKITETEARDARLLLVDYLPAGLEIDNPHLVAGGELAGLPWYNPDVEAEHTEFRDDRFVAAFKRTSDQPAFFQVAYIVRAVTPGIYAHPPAVVEDMYRPERFGRTGFGTVKVAGEP